MFSRSFTEFAFSDMRNKLLLFSVFKSIFCINGEFLTIRLIAFVQFCPIWKDLLVSGWIISLFCSSTWMKCWLYFTIMYCFLPILGRSAADSGDHQFYWNQDISDSTHWSEENFPKPGDRTTGGSYYGKPLLFFFWRTFLWQEISEDLCLLFHDITVSSRMWIWMIRSPDTTV